MLTYVNPKYLPKLKTYVCTGYDNSLVRKYILMPFYDLLMNFIPETMAPNVITLLGLILIIVSAVVSFWASPDFSNTNVPSWVFFVNAFCIFGYQTLDNLDGKQARKTKTSSALGELFDHGCDALSCTFGGVCWLILCARGATLESFAIFFVAYIAFIMASIEEYYTGAMCLGYANGPIEGVLAIVASQLLAGIFGQQLFYKTMGELFGITILANVPLYLFFFMSAGVLCIISVGTNLYSILQVIWNNPNDENRNSIVRFVFTLTPFVIIYGGCICVTMMQPAFAQAHWTLLISTLGFSMAFFNSRITLAYLVNAPVEFFHWTLLFWIAFVVNGTVFPFTSNLNMLYMLCTAATLNYIYFVIAVILQIANYLNIFVLTVKKQA